MQQNVIRLSQQPTSSPESAPLWMRHILSSAAAYADFYLDLTRSIQRCEAMIADLLSKGELDAARIALGKREALIEQRFIVESYQREHTQGEAHDRA